MRRARRNGQARTRGMTTSYTLGAPALRRGAEVILRKREDNDTATTLWCTQGEPQSILKRGRRSQHLPQHRLELPVQILLPRLQLAARLLGPPCARQVVQDPRAPAWRLLHEDTRRDVEPYGGVVLEHLLREERVADRVKPGLLDLPLEVYAQPLGVGRAREEAADEKMSREAMDEILLATYMKSRLPSVIAPMPLSTSSLV